MEGSSDRPGGYAGRNNTLTVQVLPAGIECYFDGSHPVTIGRDASANVLVRDTATSREHAVIKFEEGRWVYEDRSSNGTYLDGSQLPTRTVLERALTLSLGTATGGALIRIIPPAYHGEPSPHVPDEPVFDPGQTPPGFYSGSFRAATPRIRIGRSLDNEIVLDDLLVSRHHAEVRATSAGGFEIVDLASHNGTFVDGQPVDRRTPLHEGSLVAIGRTVLRLRGAALEKYTDAGISFTALDLSVFAGKRTLLDDVSFSLAGGQFLAVLGPTGAGKSTLLKALTGYRPADRGTVLYNGRDVYRSYAELRNRIGYVPQDDILHSQLTVRSALEYAARLRFPPDTARAERSARVDEVLSELGLTERADVRVDRLSGGQRKRTSVAIELLTKPSLLILDEPTSGLDPGYEQSVMELLRELADDGRTVLTVTHSIQSLDLCDRILFLAPGGQTAYFGPPTLTLRFFEQPGYPKVFQHLDRIGPGLAKQRFAASAQAQEFVHEPMADQRADQRILAARPKAGAKERGGGDSPRERQIRPPRGSRQLFTLIRRYLALIIADRRNTLLLFAQAPVLGLLMLAAFSTDNLKPGTAGAAANSTTVLLAMTLAACYLGASNAIREIVKERPILLRERAVGLSAWAYVLSKWLILGVITIIESFILTYLTLLRQGGPARGVVLLSGELEVAVVVSMAGLAAMSLGLLVSALAGNADKVLTILPVILFAQFVLSGSAFPVEDTPGLNQISYLAAARWGYSAAASTARLDRLLTDGCNGAPAPLVAPGAVVPKAACDPAHAPTMAAWGEDMGMLGGLIVLSVGGACLAVRPIGRPRRK